MGPPAADVGSGQVRDYFRSRSTKAAELIVSSMSAGVWAARRKGLVLAARHVHAAIDENPKVWAKRRVSQRWPPSNHAPGAGMKNSVNMLPTRATTCAAGRRVAASRARRRASPEFFQLRIRRLVAQQLERGDARGGGQRIAAQRAGLKHFAGGQHVIHDVGASAVGANGQSAADDLAQRGQVGCDLPKLLSPAKGDAKAGHHFVEDEQGAMPGGERSQCRHEFGDGITQPMLPTTGSTITAANGAGRAHRTRLPGRARRYIPTPSCPGWRPP